MRDVLERLEVLASWLKPGGQTPTEPIPDKYSTLVEAIAEIKKLRTASALSSKGSLVHEALEIAEDVLARAPFSTAILPNGMHPQVVIEKIRAALALSSHQRETSAPLTPQDREVGA